VVIVVVVVLFIVVIVVVACVLGRRHRQRNRRRESLMMVFSRTDSVNPVMELQTIETQSMTVSSPLPRQYQQQGDGCLSINQSLFAMHK